jgi:sugar phosphate isomerase/epimerase
MDYALSIEFLTTLGLPPLKVIELAADLGCRHLSMALRANPFNPEGYPPFDLVSDSLMRAEIVAALRDRGVSVSLGEGCMLSAGTTARAVAEAHFATMHDLGIRRINLVSVDPDLGRTFDHYAEFCQLASAAGFEEVVCEFAPVLSLKDLQLALDVVRHVARPDFRLLVDTMHLGRTGGTAADIAAVDPQLIGYVQIADARASGDLAGYAQEALCDRMTPGEGELPLSEFLAALPRGRVYGIEVPQLARAKAGERIESIVRSIVERTRSLLNNLPM